MSLKGFHIFFIAAATITAVFAGVWSWNAYSHSSDIGYLITSVFSFLFAALLVTYGLWFIKKLKNVE